MPRRDVVYVACPRCKADGVEMDDHHAMLCGECMGEDDEWTDAEYDALLEAEEMAKMSAAEAFADRMEDR